VGEKELATLCAKGERERGEPPTSPADWGYSRPALSHQPPTGTVDTVIASASRRPGGTMRVRAVTPPGWTPSPEWVPARPSLEEAYLWLRTFGASSSYRD